MPSDATKQWLAKAAEDNAVVEILIKAGGPWTMAAYHIQQAAEKCLKAAITELGGVPPKTHDLARLVNVIPAQVPTEDVEEAAAMLSAFAWLTRYPGSPTFTEEQIEEACAQLELIRGWALQCIEGFKTEGGTPSS